MAKKKDKVAASPFPGSLFVVLDGDGDDIYLNASESADDIDDGVSVGIYTLNYVSTLRVTRELD